MGEKGLADEDHSQRSRFSYMICATPRSGSYLLCEALTNTGVAGKPNEYLSPGFETYWRPRWGAATYDEYLRRVTELGSTPNGVFGVKVHPVQLDHYLRSSCGAGVVTLTERRKAIESRWPGLRYVWLKRNDKLEQGISYAKALQSRIWWDTNAAPAPFDQPRPQALRFDRVLLERCVTQMHLEELRWKRYFEANSIKPVEVCFEDLVADISGATSFVMDGLGLTLPAGYQATASRFQRQSDATTDEWRDRLVRLALSEPAIKLARPREPDRPKTAQRLQPETTSLDASLHSRRWWRVAEPFPTVQAYNVFKPALYQALEHQYRGWMADGRFKPDIPGYDVTAMAVPPADCGPFGVFLSREWHDMLAGLFGVAATGEINLTLHHHPVGSASGSPHNDLNPAFFSEASRRSDGILVYEPRYCNYRTGRSDRPGTVIERVRAVAVIFYLAGPETATLGGETGFYRSISDPVGSPSALVRPRNNALVAFECTPFSYHSFITNPAAERNTVVMWLHRRREEAVKRWGEGTIVGW